MLTDILTQLGPVSQGALGAFIYGMLFYSRVRLDPDNPETFEPIKFGTTVLLGALVGALFGAAGITPTYESIGFVLTTYAGSVALIEVSVKALINGNKRRAHQSALEALETAFGTTVSKGRSRDELERELSLGTSEYGERSGAERREEWDQLYPDEDTAAQVDDTGGKENDGTREDDELPPA